MFILSETPAADGGWKRLGDRQAGWAFSMRPRCDGCACLAAASWSFPGSVAWLNTVADSTVGSGGAGAVPCFDQLNSVWTYFVTTGRLNCPPSGSGVLWCETRVPCSGSEPAVAGSAATRHTPSRLVTFDVHKASWRILKPSGLVYVRRWRGSDEL